MTGNFNNNGMHNDGKLLKYTVNNNIHGLCDYIDPTEHLLVLDRGFQELFDNPFRCDFIMSSLSKAKPTPCLDSNISRLLIRQRFVNEKVYGDLEEIFPILKQQVIGQHKPHVNSWSDILVSTLNYIHPHGSITNTNDYYDNYIRYCIRTKCKDSQYRYTLVW